MRKRRRENMLFGVFSEGFEETLFWNCCGPIGRGQPFEFHNHDEKEEEGEDEGDDEDDQARARTHPDE